MRRPSYFYSVTDRRAKTLTPAVLTTLQTSEQTKRGMAEIARLKSEGQDIRPGKEMLAVVTWGARYEEGSPRGTEGALDTGLFFIDCDHLKERPTASGEGLRIIMTKLLPGKDNEANIEAFKKMHAADPAIATVDMKVKNIGHPSYVPILDYWIYFDNAILNEDNEEKEEEGAAAPRTAATEPAAAAEGTETSDELRGDYRLRLTYDADGEPIGSDGKRLQTMLLGMHFSS